MKSNQIDLYCGDKRSKRSRSGRDGVAGAGMENQARASKRASVSKKRDARRGRSKKNAKVKKPREEALPLCPSTDVTRLHSEARRREWGFHWERTL